MAYYNQTHFDEYYNQTSDTCSNNFVPQNNIYEPSIYNLFDYDPTPFNNTYKNQYHSPSFPSSHSITTAYSTFTPTELKSVQYYHHDPNCYQLTVTTHYDHTPQTGQSEKSHVEPGFNAPEFAEYDPTPYGGGYDIVQTYGRPLPPSDQTCYPLGGSRQKKKVTFSDREADKGNDNEAKPEKPPEKKEESKPKDEAPKEKHENGQVNEYDYNQPEVVSQIPSGYGLEAMDLCESLFGFWPFHAQYYGKRGNGYFACCHGNGCGCGSGGVAIGCGSEHGNGAADYLFGSCDPYVERRDGGGSFGQPIHCYERRYQEQPLSVQVEFDHHQYDHQEDNSWSHNFRIF